MAGERRPRIPADLALKIDIVRVGTPFEKFVRDVLEGHLKGDPDSPAIPHLRNAVRWNRELQQRAKDGKTDIDIWALAGDIETALRDAIYALGSDSFFDD